MSKLILQALFYKLTQYLCFVQIQTPQIVQFVQRARRQHGKPSDYAVRMSWPRVSCLFCRACVRFNAHCARGGIFSRSLLTCIKTALFLAVRLCLFFAAFYIAAVGILFSAVAGGMLFSGSVPAFPAPFFSSAVCRRF